MDAATFIQKWTQTGADERQDAASTDIALTAKEKKIYDDGLVAVLRELHDELDAAVFKAYGWDDLGRDACPQASADPASDNRTAEGSRPYLATQIFEQELLTRLVALNQQRAAEEAKGRIRWLRPEYQDPDYQESGDRNRANRPNSAPPLRSQVSALSPHKKRPGPKPSPPKPPPSAPPKSKPSPMR